jgi:hypothetical protein
MIVDRLEMSGEEFHRLTGWEIKPEGACKDDRCVPLVPPVHDSAGPIDVADVAARIGMPLAHDAAHGLWAIGPESGGRVLARARMPDLVLPDFNDQPFDVATTRGRKVLLLAWASW